MPVIAMTQEMGSLGKDVAVGVAETLGLALVRHEVVEDRVAGRMGIRKSLVRRIMEGKAGMIEGWRADKKSMAIYTAEEVFNLARQGNVLIRGWGASYLLHQVPHIMCVRVCAPMECRIKWLMERLDIDDQEFAHNEIMRSDNAHQSLMRQRYGVAWGDPVLYDLVLNTERVAIDSCVQQVIQLVQRPEFRETPASARLLENLALTHHIRALLLRDPRTESISNLKVDMFEGRALVSGTAAYEDEKNAASEVLAGVSGINGFDNQINVIHGMPKPSGSNW